jgi:hypothetical protein
LQPDGQRKLAPGSFESAGNLKLRIAYSTMAKSTARPKQPYLAAIQHHQDGIHSTNNQELPFEQHFSPSALGEL